METDISNLSDEAISVDLPDACPGCGADFTKPGNLVSERWVSEECSVQIVDGALMLDGFVRNKPDADNLVTGFHCRRCGLRFDPCNEQCEEGCDGEADSVLHRVRV